MPVSVSHQYYGVEELLPRSSRDRAELAGALFGSQLFSERMESNSLGFWIKSTAQSARRIGQNRAVSAACTCQ